MSHWIHRNATHHPLPKWAGWAFYLAMYGIPYGLLGLWALLH